MTAGSTRIVLNPCNSERLNEPAYSEEVVVGARDRSLFREAGLRKVALLRMSSWDISADAKGGIRVWLALENLQVTGSFKVRGAFYALDKAKRSGITSVIAASAGNHGAGVAYAAAVLGMDATIFLPQHAPFPKVQAIREHGATVIEVQGSYDVAEGQARAMAKMQGKLFLSPYEDDDIAAGNGSSLGFEIVRALGKVPEHVIVPVGGGGLASGMAWALAHEAKEDPRRVRRVWGAQSEISSAFADSLETGIAVESLPLRGRTLAEGLEGGIEEAAFLRAAAVVKGVYVVSEEQIGASMATLWRALGLRVEGSAAVSLAPVLNRSIKEKKGDLVVVLTGRNAEDGVFRRVVDGLCPW